MKLNTRSPSPTRLAVPFARVALCVAIAATFFGCGDDEGGSTTVVLGPPGIGITFPEEGACVVLNDDASVHVKIALQNWSLRPPGFCGDVYSQCGFAVFLVDGQEMVRSSSMVTSVPFASPAGAHRIRVELHEDSDVDGGSIATELAAEVNITTVEASGSCP